MSSSSTSEDDHSIDDYTGIPLTPMPSTYYAPHGLGVTDGSNIRVEHPHPLLRSASASVIRDDNDGEMQSFDVREITLMTVSAASVIGLATVALCISLQSWVM
ncbi:hypothetical protein FRB94_011234 [Tulasnella sp. JGI-2019a]|nr:hypothetical protein FRB93_002410 [Tulasnella sp. JGI-2019a]KAG9009952.1 hypothetical protein FRB94_011234 [Tulasnella sp. JGI-2019a]